MRVPGAPAPGYNRDLVDQLYREWSESLAREANPVLVVRKEDLPRETREELREIGPLISVPELIGVLAGAAVGGSVAAVTGLRFLRNLLLPVAGAAATKTAAAQAPPAPAPVAYRPWEPGTAYRDLPASLRKPELTFTVRSGGEAARFVRFVAPGASIGAAYQVGVPESWAPYELSDRQWQLAMAAAGPGGEIALRDLETILEHP